MSPSRVAPAAWLAERLGPPSLVLVAGLWMLHKRQGFLVDDAYISFRYAVSFAHGHGLVWNAGVPLEGYTNLLWVLLLVPFARVGLDLTLPSLVGSLGFALGTVELLRRISRRLRPEASWFDHLMPGLLLACIPSFAHAATSGMEGPCFGFLVLLAIDQLVRGREEPRRRIWAALFLALAYLARPEGALVTAILVLCELWQLEGPLVARVSALAPVALLPGVVVVLHVAARLVYYGYPLPNTFYAKVILGPASLSRGMQHFAGFLLAGGWLALPGLFELRREGPLRPWLLHGWVLAAVYVTYLVVVGGDHPVWYRFYVPLLPLPLLATSAIGARKPVVTSAVALASFSVSVRFAEPIASVFASVDDRLNRSVAEVDRFFRDEAPKDGFVAAAAVGYFGYRHPDLFVLDIWGLNDAHIAHLKLPASVKFGHDKTDLAYVAAQKPDYLLLPSPGTAPRIPGYELCAPSRFDPALVYRRTTVLAPNEANLGLPPGRSRNRGPLPSCL